MMIADALSGARWLCIETAPFVHYPESRPGNVEQMRAIVQQTQDEQITIVTSTVTLTECLTKPLRDNDTA